MVSPISGGYGEGETPLPIPNRAVKPLSADGTWPSRARESRTPPVYLTSRPPGGSSSFWARRVRPGPYAPRMHEAVILGDNLDVLPDLPDGAFQLIYADPPFNTGRTQPRRTLAPPATAGARSRGGRGRPARRGPARGAVAAPAGTARPRSRARRTPTVST